MKQRTYHTFKTWSLLLPIMVLTISFLASCGGGGGGSSPPPVTCTAPAPPGSVTATKIVSASVGNDSTASGICFAYKTISTALAASSPGDVVWVAPGTYDAALGETFPITPPANVTLIGDVASKGEGATATLISGNGASGEILFNTVVNTTVKGAEGVTLSGFKLSNGASIFFGFGLHSNGVTMTISDNTFASGTYGGVRLFGAGNPVVKNNVFHTSAYGVYARTTGSAIVQNNTFPDPALPIDVTGNMTIQSNTIMASGVVAIHVQGGSPQITNNTITSTGYTDSALLIGGSGSTIVRGNTFTIGSGYTVRLTAIAFSPDFGTAASPGNNVFAGATTGSILHEAAATVNAIGNTWHADPPGCGTGLDIEITGGGTVIWGSGTGKQCP